MRLKNPDTCFAPLAAVLLCAALFSGNAAGAKTFSEQMDVGPPQPMGAVSDLLHAFWLDAPSGGHVRGACETEQPKKVGCLWEQGQAYHALYTGWRVTGSAELKEKLIQNWHWIVAHHPDNDWATCGEGTAENYALDDTGWDIGTAMDAFDVFHDPAILSSARMALDCAYDRWHTGELGGGFWYSDARKEKTLYQSYLMNGALRYYAATGNKIYLLRAIDDEAWVASHLMITEQTNTLRFGNGLYWCVYGLTAANGRPGPVGAPFRVGEVGLASSVTFLGGNMQEAVVDARLYAITKSQVYRDRAIATAAAIREIEVLPMKVLLNDRDAWVEGWSAFEFVKLVVPLLPAAEQLAWHDIFKATADSILTRDRTADGRYGGDWQGPVDGIWTKRGSTPDQVMVNAQAVDIIVAAAAFDASPPAAQRK
jgi:hypothetical protein